MRKTLAAGIAATALVVSAGAIACETGAQDCPFPVEMKPGTDTITLVHTLQENVECCFYSLAARAGQTLTWSFDGPNERVVIVYPDGDEDGPGIPHTLPLKTDGTYVLGFVPNLMAGDAFGPFRATVTIK